MTVIRLLALLCVLITIARAQECRVNIEQQQRTSWSSDAGSFTLYDVYLHNEMSVPLFDVSMTVAQPLESFWELQLADGVYTLPDWIKQMALAPGTAHSFGYIVKASVPVTFDVLSCRTSASDAPTTAPAAPIDAATDAPTDAPADDTTDAPADDTTDAPADDTTDAPADDTTDAPADDTTDAPADDTTDAPADDTTDAPADDTTDAANAEPDATFEEEPTSDNSYQGNNKGSSKGGSKGKGGKGGKGGSKSTTRPPTTKAPTTKAPTTKATTKASTKAPSAPTTKAPSTPTTKAPSSPTTKTTTKAPVTTSPGSVSGTVCSGNTWWQPAPATTWQWQLTGTIDQSVDVQMIDIDLFDATASLISQLHSKGRVVICYFSTQYENWRPDAKSFTSSVIGHALDGWEGENWVDIRSSTVRNILAARMSLAKSKGCDGVEPDNVDGYSNTNGLGLTAANQLDFNQWLATTAHSLGLSVALKNDLAQAKALEPYFDFSINEQCYQYSECDDLNVFINAGKAVFNAEYSGSAATVCKYMAGKKFSSIIKKLSLDASITAQCCTYQTGGCAKVSHTCGSSPAKRSLEENDASRYEEMQAPEFEDVPVTYRVDSGAASLPHSLTVFVIATLALILLF